MLGLAPRQALTPTRPLRPVRSALGHNRRFTHGHGAVDVVPTSSREESTRMHARFWLEPTPLLDRRPKHLY